MSARVSLSIQINTSIDIAFQYLTDWPKQHEWMLGTHVEVKSEGDARYVGGKIAAFTGVGPVGFWDTMTITTWQAPHYVEVDHTGKLVRGIGYMRFTEIDEVHCLFEWGEVLEIPLGFIGRMGFGLLRPFFLFGVKKSLEVFKARVEALPR